MGVEKKTSVNNSGGRLFLFIILACIFFGALNLINRYYYCIYIATLFFLLTHKRRIYINSTFLVLLFFSMSILFFTTSTQDRILDMIKPFTYPLCYLMGTSIFMKGNNSGVDLKQEEKNTSTIIYVLSAGVMVHFLLNMMINWGLDNRHTIDFWTKEEMSATGQAVLACLMIGVSIAFLFSDVSKKKKFIAVAALILIISYNFILAGRTIFVLIIILSAFACFCAVRIAKKRAWKVVLIALISILAIFLLYSLDILGIKTAFESSNFYDRFMDGSNNQQLNEDARMTHKLAYLKYFFDYPWGGGHIRAQYGHSAHDLYLDTYDESGIFALITVVVYIISSITRMVQCLKAKSLTFETKLLIACIYLICNIQFWLEPIMRGVPWFFASYCFIDGSVTYLLSQEKSIQEK